MLERLTLRTKLAVLAGLPLFVVIVLIGLTAASARSDVAEAQGAERSASVAVAIGNLLHETQKERGGSSVYLSSGGANFAVELPAQHELTDEVVAAFRDAVEVHRGELHPDVVASLDEVLALLDGLTEMRAGVLSTENELGATLGWYTGMNTTLLDAISVIESETSIAELGRSTTAYRSILSGKEASGITRAQLSNVFTNDAFADGQLATVVSLLTRQRTYLGQFEALASQELVADYQAWSNDASTQATTALEAETVANGSSGFGNDPVAWFDLKTVYINGLKAIEDAQAAALEDTARSYGQDASRRFWFFIALLLIVLAASAWFVRRCAASITGPIGAVATQARRIADGDLDVELLEMEGDDEVAQLAAVFDDMTVQLRTSSEDSAALIAAMSERAAQLAADADQLTEVSVELSQGAEETAGRAASVSSASASASEISMTVSAAVKQLQDVVAQVAERAEGATMDAEQAVAVASKTRDAITHLGTSSDKIGEVIDLISKIANDTNILALNATIEAARAGEAGKGFAVVANEVKSLASQTNEATSDIRERVDQIQADVQGAVRAIDQVADVVGRISTGQRLVAESVTEQQVSTVEIATAVANVAATSEEISSDIAAVAVASDRTSANAARTRESAQSFMRLASEFASIRSERHDMEDVAVG